METEKQKKERMKSLMEGIAISKSGYGGVDKNGRIVDRRKFPDVVAMRANSIFGTPHPQIVVKCTQCDWMGGEGDLIVKPTRNGGEDEVCPNCKTNQFLDELPIV